MYLNITTIKPPLGYASYVFQQSLLEGKQENDFDLEYIDNDYYNYYKDVIFAPESMTGWRLVDFKVPLSINYAQEKIVLYTSNNALYVANVHCSWKIKHEESAIEYFIGDTNISPVYLDIYDPPLAIAPKWTNILGISKVIDSGANITDDIYRQYGHGNVIGCLGIVTRDITSNNINQNKENIIKNITTVARERINKMKEISKFIEFLDITITDMTPCGDIPMTDIHMWKECQSWVRSLNNSKPNFRPLYPYINFVCRP